MSRVFTDSHCHLAMVEPDAVSSAIERARSEGVAGFVVPATNLGDAARAVAVAQEHEGVWSAVGFHPHEAKDCDDAAFAEIERLSVERGVVAIGEVGLDFHYMHSPQDTQKEVLLRHIALARRRDLPVIIHNRESTADLLDLLAMPEVRGVRGVIHSFTENHEVAVKLLDLGFDLSFSGILTFRTAETLRDAARRVPHDRVLIETDTPYLAPVPKRGKENEPAFVVHIAEMLASLWSVAIEEVAERTTANFERLFRVEVPR